MIFVPEVRKCWERKTTNDLTAQKYTRELKVSPIEGMILFCEVVPEKTDSNRDQPLLQIKPGCVKEYAKAFYHDYLIKTAKASMEIRECLALKRE